MNARQRFFCVMVTLSFLAAATRGQDKKHEAQLRTVRGVVTDKSENPLSGYSAVA